MSDKLYVGNLSYDCTQDDLTKKFGEYGEVTEAVTISDKFTGRSKGFGFVTFSDASSAQKAVDEMNGQEWMGRTLRVDKAKPPRSDNRQRRF